MTKLRTMLVYSSEVKISGILPGFAISWKVVEAVVLVFYIILKYESNLY